MMDFSNNMDALEYLKKQIGSYEKVAIAYSGGCDSNFLYHLCLEVLGEENVLPILVKGAMMSSEDLETALGVLDGHSASVLEVDVFSIPEFEWNDKRRCYFCKKKIMSEVKKEALRHGITVVFDGQNQDDQKEYRPGRQAVEELGILSPLSGLSKEQIRSYSHQMGLDTAFKPANACLASRFDYGRHLDQDVLKRVEKAEEALHSIGILHVRVRDHDSLARIEVEEKDQKIVLDNRTFILEALQKAGYRYVTLDLKEITSGGYDHDERVSNRL